MLQRSPRELSPYCPFALYLRYRKPKKKWYLRECLSSQAKHTKWIHKTWIHTFCKMDLRKAFNSVNHSYLLKKKLQQRLASYPIGREHYRVLSKIEKIKVQQGSILTEGTMLTRELSSNKSFNERMIGHWNFSLAYQLCHCLWFQSCLAPISA